MVVNVFVEGLVCLILVMMLMLGLCRVVIMLSGGGVVVVVVLIFDRFIEVLCVVMLVWIFLRMELSMIVGFMFVVFFLLLFICVC